MTTRRSERLRRKRQSTPGLSQPGNYSLYNSGYVVESEASYLPDLPREPLITPKSSRRVRYRDSPQVFDVSPLNPSWDDHDDDDLQHQRAPETPRRTLTNRVRTSLFDILNSATKRPARSSWRFSPLLSNRFRNSDDQQQQQQQQQPEEEEQSTPAQESIVVDEPQTQHDRYDATVSRTPSPPFRFTPLILLIFLFGAAFSVLLLLDSYVQDRASAPPKWHAIRDTCIAATTATTNTFATLTTAAAAVPSKIFSSANSTSLQLLAQLKSASSVLVQKLWRPAWRGAFIEADYITRSELENKILPQVIAQAKKTAAQEASRLSALVPTPKSEDLQSFIERYAADKDLPADFALGSIGATVMWTKPSVVAQYGQYVRMIAEALLSDGVVSPVLPRRPRMALDERILPGNCWSFDGSRGTLVVRLARPVRATSVTIEHTPRSSVFSSLSAPRRFEVTGINVLGQDVPLGSFEFEFDLDDAPHLQRFAVKSQADVLRAVRLDILSNHGGLHTSLYRFRLHGDEVSFEDMHVMISEMRAS